MTLRSTATQRKKQNTSPLAQRLFHTITSGSLFTAGDRVAVAVSGGADSTALLRLLLELREALGIVICVAHFNHKLRGSQSDADESFTRKLADTFALEFFSASSDVRLLATKAKANLEDVARRERQQFLAKLTSQEDLNRVLVAHTLDDQAETVLAHLMRGSGLAGLGAMPSVSGNIVRPLLQIRREELRKYLRSKKQLWREDASNRDLTRTRARIRKKLLPFLEREFQPQIAPHLASLAELARADEAYLQAATQRFAHSVTCSDGRSTRVALENFGPELALEDFALWRRLIRQIASRHKIGRGELQFKHIESVLNLGLRGQNGKHVLLPGGVEVRRVRHELIFVSKHSVDPTNSGNREFAYGVTLATGDGDPGLLASFEAHEIICRFSLMAIDWPPKREETSGSGRFLAREFLAQPLVLRNWRPGDRFQPLGYSRAHKLKRLLNEARISRWDRDGWPVLTSAEKIVWVRGFPVAAGFEANHNTQIAVEIREEALQDKAESTIR